MSPTEASLRAALRDGEGDGVDPDVIITRALRLRQERRHQWRTAGAGLAAAAVVGGLALGISQTSGSGDQATSANAGSGARAESSSVAAAPEAAGGAAAPTVRPAVGANAGSAACPERPLPPTGPPGGSSGRLFARTPASMTVCAYEKSNGQSLVARSTLSGATARRLAADLENSHLRGDPNLCKLTAPEYEVLPQDTRGRPLDPVSLIPGCEAYAATNGAVTRYVAISSPAMRLIATAAHVLPDRTVPPHQ